MSKLPFDTYELTAKEAVSRVSGLRKPTAEKLDALHEHEAAHPNYEGGRKTVLDVIEERIGQLEVDEPAEGTARGGPAPADEPEVVDPETDDETATEPQEGLEEEAEPADEPEPTVVPAEKPTAPSNPPKKPEGSEPEAGVPVTAPPAAGETVLIEHDGQTHEGVIDCCKEGYVVVLKDGAETRVFVEEVRPKDTAAAPATE